MPKLPTARQNRLPSTQATDRAADRKSLAHAFRTFTRVAGSLEKSYAQLQGEVGRLREELESANAELSRKVEGEFARTRISDQSPRRSAVWRNRDQLLPRATHGQSRSAPTASSEFWRGCRAKHPDALRN